MPVLRSRHSERHEHTGKNEATKRKKKGGLLCNHFQLLKKVEPASLPQTPNKNGCQKAKIKKKGLKTHEIHQKR